MSWKYTVTGKVWHYTVSGVEWFYTVSSSNTWKYQVGLQETESDWILATGFWDDDGVWVDGALWID